MRKKSNTRSLPNFAMACDRAKISDNMGSMLACALLIDYGIVTKDDSVNLIDPSKVRHEQERHGRRLEEVQRSQELPHGIYTDGKRVPTLVRAVRETKVAVAGGRGRAQGISVAPSASQTKHTVQQGKLC